MGEGNCFFLSNSICQFSDLSNVMNAGKKTAVFIIQDVLPVDGKVFYTQINLVFFGFESLFFLTGKNSNVVTIFGNTN